MTLYIYAITQADGRGIDIPNGISGQTVHRVESGPIGAFVSDYEGKTIRAERRHIAASQAVLRTLQASIDLLPMAFGTLTPSADTLVDLLDMHSEALLAELDRVGGAVEMGVRVKFETADPIAYLVERSVELRQARDRAFQPRKSPSQDERMRLGQLCQTALRTYQETQAAHLVAQLSAACTEITTLPIRDDRQVANLAVLVPRDGVQAFEDAVNAAAETFDDDLAFDLNGPWPPHNFVHVELVSG